MWLIVVASIAHTNTASFGQEPTSEECPPSKACIDSRVCTFGDVATYNVVRRQLFEATGYPLACIDACQCNPNPSNRIASLLSKAAGDPTVYNNNSACSNQVLMSAMDYITANLPCEAVFAEAQVPLFKLCGTQNGVPCRGKCTQQYQIDTPLGACYQRTGATNFINFVTAAMVVALGVLWVYIPGSTYTVLKKRAPKKSIYSKM